MKVGSKSSYYSCGGWMDVVLIEYDDDGNGIELVVCECIWFEQPIKRFHDEPS